MWKNILEPDVPQMTARPIRIACWIIKATGTHAEHVTNIKFRPQEWLHRSTSLSRYRYFAGPVISVPKAMLRHRTALFFKHFLKR